jgi:hypothetical protein
MKPSITHMKIIIITMVTVVTSPINYNNNNNNIIIQYNRIIKRLKAVAFLEEMHLTSHNFKTKH